MSFSIIAIKTGVKPSKKAEDQKNNQIEWDHLKVLGENTLFKLNNAFTFENEDFKKIIYSYDSDINIFKVQSDKKTIPVSIQAIVGGNGSGKSTLIELIYWANYNIGARLNLFEVEYPINKALDFQLFYRLNQDDYYLLHFQNGNITQEEYCLDKDGEIILKISEKNHISTITSLKNFFYSVVVNYSLYSLNEQEVGTWIHPLFHKNDGYQTPIVLNPKREEKSGINIEVERKLVSRRLQALCLEPIKNDEIIGSLRDFGNGKIATNFKIELDPEYHLGLHNNLNEPKGKIVESLAEKISEVFSFEKKIERDDYFTEICLNYILRKLIKIGGQYPNIFGKYIVGAKLKNGIHLKNYLENIKRSSSHIVFKAKGAILYLKYKNEILGHNLTSSSNSYIIDISKFSDFISDLKNKEQFYLNTFIFTPPSFVKTEIILNDESTIDSLSSGERQRIHSISSLLYHIVNLNSVEEQKLKENKKLVKYEYINLILDEIELYYHPEWQRTYVNDLITGIEKLNTDKLNNLKGINITFITHSPFILSDIPVNNVLKLVNGLPKESMQTSNTFGANIHDLLAADFFLDKGFMGEFAKEKIQETILFLNYHINQMEINTLETQNLKNPIDYQKKKIDYLSSQNKFISSQLKNEINISNHLKHLSIINLIGENVLKEKLTQMYNLVFKN